MANLYPGKMANYNRILPGQKDSALRQQGLTDPHIKRSVYSQTNGSAENLQSR